MSILLISDTKDGTKAGYFRGTGVDCRARTVMAEVLDLVIL